LHEYGVHIHMYIGTLYEVLCTMYIVHMYLVHPILIAKVPIVSPETR
jgi:hypothetical protein